MSITPQKDRQGTALPGATAEAATHYADAVHALNIYTGDPVALVDAAIEAAPEFTSAHILKAWLYLTATEPEATAEARGIVESAKLNPDARESSHLKALDLLLAGRWNDAATALDHHNMAYPHDLVALQVGHLLDFYRGCARNLRDRITRVLPHWTADRPGYGILQGMLAFGLEETGNYEAAHEAGHKAVEAEPLDSWAHHAVAHAFEMEGRASEGVSWMVDREPHWAGEDNFIAVHNWWHRALFHLDLGQLDQVFQLYDAHIRPADAAEPSPVALDLVDAAALLWRLILAGHDIGDRAAEPAETWLQHADGRTYPFNDLHALMANLAAGRDESVTQILTRLKDAAMFADGDPGEWARDIGLPLAEGFVAFHRGQFATTVEKLHPTRFIANRFGGSHAQRDVIDWTLTEAAVRGGLSDVAEALANERLALKPVSPVNRAFLTRAREAADAKRAA